MFRELILLWSVKGRARMESGYVRVSALTSCFLHNGHGGGAVLLQTRPWQPEGGSLIGPSPHDSSSAVGALLMKSVLVQEREFAHCARMS